MDPSTDLRGCGFLGLMNILYLVTEPRAHVLVTNIYKLSLHETQNFPFSVMSINITRIALQTLREGKLNRYVIDGNHNLHLYVYPRGVQTVMLGRKLSSSVICLLRNYTVTLVPYTLLRFILASKVFQHSFY